MGVVPDRRNTEPSALVLGAGAVPIYRTRVHPAIKASVDHDGTTPVCIINSAYACPDADTLAFISRRVAAAQPGFFVWLATDAREGGARHLDQSQQ